MLDYLYDPPTVTHLCPGCLETRLALKSRELTPSQRNHLKRERLGLGAPVCAHQLYEEVERWTYKPGWRMWIEHISGTEPYDGVGAFGGYGVRHDAVAG